MDFSLILKGFVIGVGKIIPGVSGSLIALSFGLYEKCINAISNFFKDFKKNSIFLGTLSIGIICAIILGSRIIIYFMNNYYVVTMLLFTGLILGGLPNLFKNKNFDFKNISIFLIGFSFMIILSLFKNSNDFSPNNIIIFLLGFIDAVTMIIPGISGTAIFILIGCYDFILNMFSQINLIHLTFFGAGVFIGVIIVSKIMNYLFKEYKDQVYMFVIGLGASSICILIKKTMDSITSIMDIILGLILLIIGYKISMKSINWKL